MMLLHERQFVFYISLIFLFILHRIIRAFLIEEQKIVKKVLAEKARKGKKE
jgi:hypothetical protein